jgi:hypothetical protein
MTRPVTTAVLILVGYLTLPASAQAPEPQTYGFGNASCGEWRQGRKEYDAEKLTYSQAARHGWVLGWLNAGSLYHEPIAETDSQAALAFIDDYCAQNPLDRVVDASTALVTELQRRAR